MFLVQVYYGDTKMLPTFTTFFIIVGTYFLTLLSGRTKLFIIQLICRINNYIRYLALSCTDLQNRVNMKNVKNFNVLYGIPLSMLLICCSSAKADERFDFSAELNDPVTDAFLNNTEFQTTRAIDPADVVQLLVGTFNAPCLLENNFYIYTYPLNKKSIIDVPAFFPYRDYSRKSTFGMSLFLNQTWRMFFTQDCDGIQSYLAICSPNLLQRISQCVECAKAVYPNFNINPMVIFPLFRNIAVQDRQLGMMLHGDKQFKQLHLHVHVPVLYQQRNYYMTQDERDCIENAFNEVLAPVSEQDESHVHAGQCATAGCSDDQHYVGTHKDADNPIDMEFVQNHLIGDKFGIGDTRIHLDWDLIKRHYYSLALGLVATVPTAFAFKKGLLGASFEDTCAPKDFSISNLVELAQNGNAYAATAIGQAFALGALDQVSQNLLDTGLGYGKHLGLGVSYNTMGRLSYIIKRPWAHHIKMRSRMILQYYFPAHEIRSFVENKNPADYSEDNFDLDRVATDPAYAQNRLDFINEKLIQEFYPFKLRTLVCPNIIFQSTSGYYFEANRWKLQLVTDFWAKMQESFGTICIPPGTPPLEIWAAKRPSAYQSRIGGLVAYSMPGVSSSWTISFYGDKTYWSKGIGKDFNVVFNVECNF